MLQGQYLADGVLLHISITLRKVHPLKLLLNRRLRKQDPEMDGNRSETKPLQNRMINAKGLATALSTF